MERHTALTNRETTKSTKNNPNPKLNTLAINADGIVIASSYLNASPCRGSPPFDTWP